MEPEERQLLEHTAALAEENNKMLRGMRRAMIWGRVYRVFYWTLIIGLSIGAFYFLEPYVTGLQKAVESVTGGQSFRELVN